MAFTFRVYLTDGTGLDDYVASVPNWSAGDMLYFNGAPTYRVSAVIPINDPDNEVYAGILEVEPAGRMRPASDALVEDAEDYANRLVEIALHGEEAAALRAIEAFNSRVLGKPTETVESVEVPADLQRIRDMSPDEIAALWRAHLDEVSPLQ